MFLLIENCIQNFSGDAVQPSHLISWNFWRRYLTPSWINIKTGHYCGFMMPRWKIIGMYFLFSHLQLPQYNTPPPKATRRVGDKVYYMKCHQFTTTTTLFFPSSKYYVKRHPLPCHDTSILHEICVSHCLWIYTDTIQCAIVGGCQLQKLHPTSSSLHKCENGFFFWLKSQVFTNHAIISLPRNCCS